MIHSFYFESGVRTSEKQPTKSDMIDFYTEKRDEYKEGTPGWKTCQDVLDILARSRTIGSAAKRISEYWHNILWYTEMDSSKPLDERLTAGYCVDICIDFHKAMGDIIAMDVPRSSSHTRYPSTERWR